MVGWCELRHERKRPLLPAARLSDLRLQAERIDSFARVLSLPPLSLSRRAVAAPNIIMIGRMGGVGGKRKEEIKEEKKIKYLREKKTRSERSAAEVKDAPSAGCSALLRREESSCGRRGFIEYHVYMRVSSGDNSESKRDGEKNTLRDVVVFEITESNFSKIENSRCH